MSKFLRNFVEFFRRRLRVPDHSVVGNTVWPSGLGNRDHYRLSSDGM